MRIITWNVNSAIRRADQIAALLDGASPDILCLQETKAETLESLETIFTDRGYVVGHSGAAGGYNGVGVASRIEESTFTAYGVGGRLAPDGTQHQSNARQASLLDELEEPADELDGEQGENRVLEREPRLVICSTPHGDFGSVYVPNGRVVDHWHYHYKLAWLQAITDIAHGRRGKLSLMGDFNVAPRDEDVWNPKGWIGKTHVSPRERAAIETLLADGSMVDAAVTYGNESFTWWNYRGAGYDKNQGLRIDLALIPANVKERVTDVRVLSEWRTTSPASDHAPVLVDIEGDII